MFLLMFLSEMAFFLRQCYDLFAKIRYTMLQQLYYAATKVTAIKVLTVWLINV